MLSFRRLGYGLLLLGTIITLCSYMGWLEEPRAIFDTTDLLHTGTRKCHSELADVRKALNLPNRFQYGRRTFLAKPVKKLLPQSVVHREEKLFQGLDEINFHDRDCAVWVEDQPVEMEFQMPQRTMVDPATLMVGASTTLSRLEKALPQMARWLGNTSTPLIVNIKDSNDYERFERIQEQAEALHIDATLVLNVDHGPEKEDRHAHRHFSILKVLNRYKLPSTKWFAIIDDDTFFPSLTNLLEALEPYNPAEEWYIGALSEDWHTIANRFGFMAYGGAGIFLSAPLFDTLYENFESCKAVGGLEGDRLYRDCIYLHTSPPVQLTLLPGLNQMDFFGDPSGWYESGIPKENGPLSIHHLNGWHRYPVQYGHIVSDICGAGKAGCFLQRYKFNDDIILTNGYSLVEYPNGMMPTDLDRVEGTFLHEKGQFDFSLGALREKVSEKISWRLEYSVAEEDGRVRQFYVKRGGKKDRPKDDEKRMELDVTGVFEIEWRVVK